MKKYNLLLSLMTALGIIVILNANAQTSEPGSNDNKSVKLAISSPFDFVPGDSVIFVENFSKIPDGSTTPAFKTNGSATVVSVQGKDGKWLALADNATYKLSKQIFYPKHFSVEFDVLAVADQSKDIYPVPIGFVKDNGIKQYNDGEGAYIDLKYYNGEEVDVNSLFTNKFLNTQFDLPSYANRAMHVSIIVNGDRMVVYLDKTKLADTQAFLPGSAKNLYISGPMQYHNGSKVLVSNFKIAKFKRR
ncbi:hypothetical protein G7092_03200 [Mucilaginibacter sp. HC2]|uniref:hypothetical protein n=1 Tax=Mucilaginibacter inviolabilis TaxID=2714892 RepID=UPI001407709E|nr:hypothetical protein [Mucilaginibacter inviolabilis]NHA02783.1 hypothetical protein [Mucilaginibacter inviolabilis]